MSTPVDVINAVVAQCQMIQIVNGFNTDAGLNVAVGKRFLDSEDTVWDTAISILFAIKTISSAAEDHREQMTLTIVGQSKLDSGDYLTIWDKLDRDIKQAVPIVSLSAHAEDVRPSGSFPRQPDPGGNIVESIVTYIVNYWDTYPN